uniref:N-acetyltransferase domain-containing protein n=1 Tax=Spongospora subterranea TaxID=70186 RepID=A0A0H5R592_9EUKA|eukprot:CRZ03304.1 hypothetical protein [Spongospora subterranea]
MRSALDVLMASRQRSHPHTSVKKKRAGRPKSCVPGSKFVQTCLDVGQSSLGSKTCDICQMVYNAGDPNDEWDHRRHHDKFVFGIDMHSILSCHYIDCLTRYTTDHFKIVRVRSPFSAKIREIIKLARSDLGMIDDPTSIIAQEIFIAISPSNRAIGCAVIEPISLAYIADQSARVQTSESAPVRVGIDLIWVLSSHRRKGIGSSLLDAIREHFAYGLPIQYKEVAFSQPTQPGARFARKYIHPNPLLVYSSHKIR